MRRAVLGGRFLVPPLVLVPLAAFTFDDRSLKMERVCGVCRSGRIWGGTFFFRMAPSCSCKVGELAKTASGLLDDAHRSKRSSSDTRIKLVCRAARH